MGQQIYKFPTLIYFRIFSIQFNNLGGDEKCPSCYQIKKLILFILKILDILNLPLIGKVNDKQCLHTNNYGRKVDLI